MADLSKPISRFAELELKYDKNAPSAALFFISSPPSPAPAVKALRILVKSINKEFADNTLFGKSHDGVFYYDDKESLDQAVHYTLERVVDRHDDKICAWVQFSATEKGKPICEFLCHEPDGDVTSKKYSHQGQWSDLTYGSSGKAILQKDENANTLTFDATGSIEYKAKLTFSPAFVDSAEALQTLKPPPPVEGNIYYKDYSSIRTSKWADFNSDRILFYVDQGPSTNEDEPPVRDYTGFFIPNEPLDKIAQSIDLAPSQIALFSVTTPK